MLSTLPKGASLWAAFDGLLSLQGIYQSCFVAPQDIQRSWDDIGGLEAVKHVLVRSYDTEYSSYAVLECC